MYLIMHTEFLPFVHIDGTNLERLQMLITRVITNMLELWRGFLSGEMEHSNHLKIEYLLIFV